MALVHHQVILNIIPFEKVAEFFAGCGEWLIVEFVLKGDTKVRKSLRHRLDIFSEYPYTNL